MKKSYYSPYWNFALKQRTRTLASRKRLKDAQTSVRNISNHNFLTGFPCFFWTKQRIQGKNYNAIQYYLTRNRSRKTGSHQGRPLGNRAK